MLELRSIKKDYIAGENKVEALKGVSLEFRKSEFVSILGPSGCGKTTMLNIIGGLDKYTDGDLIIRGKSTKEYKDRDWDSYRNHSVGFVFQSYNLITHQNVLQNVELALTLSGVSKAERRKRAKEALEAVGLGNQLYKKPGEMSGGQMQRVAIARAIVNNPDIILADEPTGALDTETSLQVMEILKEISKDRLVVMVTHNPELAEKYSSRIIKMLDGVITDDSAPLTDKEREEENAADREEIQKAKKVKKPSMSFFTSFMLSLKNLFTKKGRTTLTAFAGSIGIIGIALIFAVSQGMTMYIDIMQENALSSYPLSIQKTTIDMMSLMQTFMNISNEHPEHENDAVYKKTALGDIVNALNSVEETENDLTAFKAFLETNMKDKDSDLAQAISGIQYSYDLDLLIYTENVDGEIIRSDTEELLTQLMIEYMGLDMSASSGMGSGSSMMSMSPMSMGGVSLWQELLPNNDGGMINDLLKNQYEIIDEGGRWPTQYDEIVLVVDGNNELDDITLYALGLLPKEDIDAIMDAAMNKTELEAKENKWSFEEIKAMEFKTILNADCYTYDEAKGHYTDLRETDTGLKYLYDKGITLKVTGIIKPKEDSDAQMLSGTIGYTSALTKYVLDNAKKSDVIKAQLESESIDVLTGLPFKENTGKLSDEEKQTKLLEYLSSLDTAGKANAYIKIMSIPADDALSAQVQTLLSGMKREDMEAALMQGLSQEMTVSADEIKSYIEAMSDEDLKKIFEQILTEQFRNEYAATVEEQLAAMTTEQLAAALDMAVATYTAEQCGVYYDEIMEFSLVSYEDNLTALGYISLDDPSAINIYTATFENKDVITAAIDSYNNSVDEVKHITYTDYIGLLISSITAIIDAISYVLIAFVSISLIVSSIMIGVITLISVQERTKEIGILRAIGASKRNVSGMFNAETVIIGFISGLLGVVVTYLLCIPINIILHAVTGIGNLNAVLPVGVAIALIIISVLLTLISGIIPSRSAAKKDPVVALRTE